MKKIISIILACVMVFSCMSVLAFADTIQYYRNDDFEFYIGEDGGAHIVYIHFSESSAEELNIPFRLCYDDEYMIGEPSFNGIEKDDNDAPDPFGSDYAYVTAVESEALNNYLTTLKKISFERYVSDIDIDSLRLEQLEEIVVDERNETFATSNGTLYSADKKKLILHPQGSSDNSILSSVTSFEKKAFADSTKITSITIPSGVTNIPERCFEGCTALESIDMSAAAIGKIGTFAFLNTALTSVTFGTGIKLIDDFAFFGNKNLTSVTIPQGATNVVLDDGVFIGCPIEELTVYRSIVEMGEKTIGFYYDEEFALQQYPDLVITTYKYDAQMQNTTPLYDYVKTNSIKFIPLDDIYCVNCNFNQMNG
ncbi:MAG: leucine-rich repeat domain-containing protein, partial [Clostridia bacterium]|nr:leucine-rich repeat domain-containing protein [Clostridia bacterium]